MHHLTAFALCYIGMASLSLAMKRHYNCLWTGHPSVPLRRGLRLLGGLSLISSFAFSVHAWGGGVGSVAWTGFLTAAALLTAALLTYAPRTALISTMLAPLMVIFAIAA